MSEVICIHCAQPAPEPPDKHQRKCVRDPVFHWCECGANVKHEHLEAHLDGHCPRRRKPPKYDHCRHCMARLGRREPVTPHRRREHEKCCSALERDRAYAAWRSRSNGTPSDTPQGDQVPAELTAVFPQPPQAPVEDPAVEPVEPASVTAPSCAPSEPDEIASRGETEDDVLDSVEPPVIEDLPVVENRSSELGPALAAYTTAQDVDRLPTPPRESDSPANCGVPVVRLRLRQAAGLVRDAVVAQLATAQAGGSELHEVRELARFLNGCGAALTVLSDLIETAEGEHE